MSSAKQQFRSQRQLRIPTILLVLLVGLTPIVLVSLLVFGSTLRLVAWQPPIVWSSEFSVPLASNLTSVRPDVNDVASVFASSDNLYAGGILGYPDGVINSSTGRLFVARYDLFGHQVWVKQFGDPSISKIDAVVAGIRGVSVVGILSGRGFVRYYDVNGTEVWNNDSSSSESEVYDVSIGQSAVYAAGYNYLANNSQVEMLQAYDFKGKIVWTSTLDSPHGSELLNVNTLATSDGIYVARSDHNLGAGVLQLYALDGTLKWARQLGCSSCSTTSLSGDGTSIYLEGYVIAGQNFFLSKYDFGGNEIWTRQFSTEPPGGSALGASTDSSGIYLATAGLNGGGSIVKYDGQGNQIWSLTVKPTLHSISVVGGGVYVGGTNKVTGGNAFLAEYGQSSSLILFGLNPPFSFGLAALLAVSTVTTVWWLRRHYENKSKPHSPDKGLLKSKRIPGDALRLIHDGQALNPRRVSDEWG